MTEEQLKELIKNTVTEMYREIAAIAKEAANVTSNVAGYDTSVWGKPKRKFSLLDLDDGDVEDD